MLRTLGLFLALGLLPALAIDWKPVAPEERDLKASRVEKDAEAEIVFWDIYVTDTIRSLPYTEHTSINYIRIKIYTDRGAEARAQVKIPYASFAKTSLSEVRGRTIQPDGSVVDVRGDQIFDSVLAKFGKRTRVKAK